MSDNAQGTVRLTNLQMVAVDGHQDLFNAYANVTLNRGPQRQEVTFSLDFPNVKSSDDVRRALPDAVREFAKELSDASDKLRINVAGQASASGAFTIGKSATGGPDKIG